jgi:hypothetical protein
MSARDRIVGLGLAVSAMAVLIGVIQVIGAVRGINSSREGWLWGAVAAAGAVGLTFMVPAFRSRAREAVAAMSPEEKARDKADARSVYRRGSILLSLAFAIALSSDGLKLLELHHRVVIAWTLLTLGGVFALTFIVLLGLALYRRLNR